MIKEVKYHANRSSYLWISHSIKNRTPSHKCWHSILISIWLVLLTPSTTPTVQTQSITAIFSLSALPCQVLSCLFDYPLQDINTTKVDSLLIEKIKTWRGAGCFLLVLSRSQIWLSLSELALSGWWTVTLPAQWRVEWFCYTQSATWNLVTRWLCLVSVILCRCLNLCLVLLNGLAQGVSQPAGESRVQIWV